MSARSDRSRRTPVARHGTLRSPNPLLQVLTVLGAMVAVVAISVSAVGAFAVWDAARAAVDTSVSIGDEDVVLPPTIGEIEGGVNLLLVGSDSCEGQDVTLFPRCANDDAEGERNDVTMLLHISDNPRRVTVVSFPRDMLVPIPSCTGADGTQYSAMSSQMLNASYMYGGLPCTVSTIEALTGIDIQFAASIRWTGVINMSDALGGVDVCVSGDISDVHTGLNLAAGTHNLSGVQALQFLRIRHGIGDGSDLGRISNQQQFMSSLVRRLQSEGVLGNPGILLSLATTAVKQVNTGQLLLSSSLANPQRMVQIAMAVKDVAYEDIVFVQYPTVYASDGSHVLPLTDDAAVLFDALAANVPLQLSGATSDGYGTEVVGDAVKPTPVSTETPSPDDTAAPAPVEPAGPAAVVLPGTVTGTTAAQVTCTVPEG